VASRSLEVGEIYEFGSTLREEEQNKEMERQRVFRATNSHKPLITYNKIITTLYCR
jgi:hypothetical protein